MVTCEFACIIVVAVVICKRFGNAISHIADNGNGKNKTKRIANHMHHSVVVCVFVVGVVMLLSVSLLSSVVGGGVIVAMVLDHVVGKVDTIASVVYCVRVVFVVAGNVIHPPVCSQPLRDGDLVRTYSGLATGGGGQYRDALTTLINSVMKRNPNGSCVLDLESPHFVELRQRSEGSFFKNYHTGYPPCLCNPHKHTIQHTSSM